MDVSACLSDFRTRSDVQAEFTVVPYFFSGLVCFGDAMLHTKKRADAGVSKPALQNRTREVSLRGI